MNYRMVSYILGKLMMISALLLSIPLFVAIIYKENTILAYILPIAFLLVFGFISSIKKPARTVIFAREGFIVVALSWIILSVAGAFPFFLSLKNIPFLDCLFESVSGITTTGASIFPEIEALPESLNFLRCFTNWIGGMGVLVFVLAIIPLSDTHSFHLMRAEVPGPRVGKLVSRVTLTSKILYGIYIILTLIEVILLFIGGMPLYDSIVTSFATAGTGGFAIKNISIAAYNSPYIEYVIGVFMLVFGINFNMFYFILLGRVLDVFKNEELRYYLAIVAGAIVLITLNIRHLSGSISESVRYAFFQVSSIITTTGFSTTDFNLWPSFSKALLVLLMFFGACAGSTGGGMKISRVIILFKTALREIKYAISPKLVKAIRFENRALDTPVVRGVSSFFIMYMVIFTFSVLILALDRFDMVTSFTAVASCFNNIGPGLGEAGPLSNYSGFSGLSKAVLIFDMLSGRLEIYPILMLFSPSVWRNK